MNEKHFQEKRSCFVFVLHAAKGTYVRTLAVMIGERLGYPAHMSYLIRTASEPFSLEQCVTFEEIEKQMAFGDIKKLLLPIEKALFHLPKYQINDKLAEKVKNGAVLPLPHLLQSLEGPIVMVDEQNEAIALYSKHPSKPHLIKPLKVFR